MKIEVNRPLVIIGLAIMFMIGGWVTPVFYASYAPQEEYVEVHSIQADDVHVSADTHYVCWDRTIHQTASGSVSIQMILVDNDGRRVVETESFSSFYERGRQTVELRLDFPNNVSPGEYRYMINVKMNLASGRVSRTFSYMSQPFNVTDELPKDLNTCGT